MKPKKNRDTFLLYGFHAVREAWLNPKRTIQALYLTQQAQRGFTASILKSKNPDLTRPDPEIVKKKQLEKMLPRGAVHQGVALSCSPLQEYDVQDFIIRAHQREQGEHKTVFVILDQVTDPHNVGAILRSAAAFGLDGVIMQKKHAPSLDGVLAKSACGAVDHVPVAQETNLSRAVKALQDEGFCVFGLDERGTQDIGKIGYLTESSGKVAIVLGAEGSGIRRLVKESCDCLIRLPTQDTIRSLNVSNAAAVTFYALMHRA